MNGMISFIPEIFTLFASMSILMLGLIKKRQPRFISLVLHFL